MAHEHLTLPKLPPGKRMEQILAMSEKQFAEVAEFAGLSPTDLRERLEKIIARSVSLAQPTAKEKTTKRRKPKKKATAKPKLEKEVLINREDIVKTGLMRFFLEDVSYDDASVANLKDTADAVYTQAERKYSLRRPFLSTGTDEFTPPPSIEKKLMSAYRALYEALAMRFVADRISKGISWKGARVEAIQWLRDTQKKVNLMWERRGIEPVIDILQSHIRGEGPKLRSVYDSLHSGGMLSIDQKIEIESLCNRSQKFSRLRRWERARAEKDEPALYEVYLALERASSVRKIRKEGSDLYVDASGEGAYDHSRSRPRRDMYGSSGGDNDR